MISSISSIYSTFCAYFASPERDSTKQLTVKTSTVANPNAGSPEGSPRSVASHQVFGMKYGLNPKMVDKSTQTYNIQSSIKQSPICDFVRKIADVYIKHGYQGISAIGNKAVKGNPKIKDELYNAFKYYVLESISSNEINQVVALKLRFLLHTFIMTEEELVPLTRIIVQIKPYELDLTTCQYRFFTCLFSLADDLDEYSLFLTNQTLQQYINSLKFLVVAKTDDNDQISNLRSGFQSDLDCIKKVFRTVSLPIF
jgi:hypothetical protein